MEFQRITDRMNESWNVEDSAEGRRSAAAARAEETEINSSVLHARDGVAPAGRIH